MTTPMAKVLIAALLVTFLAGCSSSDDDTQAPTATPTLRMIDLCTTLDGEPTECPEPVTSPTPTPLGPCRGADAVTCSACPIDDGCCLTDPGPQCFSLPGGIVNTLCNSQPLPACIYVGTPTLPPTATVTPTPTQTGTPTGTATGTSTATPEGGVPTPTLAPGVCDNSCSDDGPPAGCTPLAANGATVGDTPPPLVVSSCLTVGSGLHVYGYVNVIAGGTLYFEDDGGTIDFRAGSILVQQGGRLAAGAWCCPFGARGGKLEIGLWGGDPTDQGTVTDPATLGIGCVDGSGTTVPCFDPSLVASPHYCTVSGTDDPCSSTTAPADVGDNALFEGHMDHGGGGLPFDAGSAFGYKVLAVASGGSLELFGNKGVAAAHRTDPSVAETTCPVPAADEQSDPTQWAQLSGDSWARLDGSAAKGELQITVDRQVGWQQGDELVVATTDWHAGHSEVVTVAQNEGNGSLILNGYLEYDHHGRLYDVTKDVADPPNANHEVDVRAAVGLLSRDIRVYSLGETYDQPFPAASTCGYQGDDAGNATTPGSCYFGGHVIAVQGFQTFQVQGVEFAQLGQGGRLAHYPVHFHMAKSTAYTNAFVKDSAIHDSMTRFVTVHATHDVEVARNVGHLSVGHGFYIEDGTEIDNLFCYNLAVSVRGSSVEYLRAQDPDSPTYRFSPPILPSVQNGDVQGSDASFPVGFWAMNTWNEFVGNKVAGVGAFGSCYWLLGSGVSGPSLHLSWSDSTTSPQGYANFNLAGNTSSGIFRQAPLKRFRGNSCSTAQYALQTTLTVQPTSVAASLVGYTPTVNPYAITSDMLPAVSGNYMPVAVGNVSCAPQRTTTEPADANAEACVLTLIDRFTTSFNWAPANYGAVWLRPQFFAFVNGAVTDQLFGGLTFVSGGSWNQAPAGYFTITMDGVYAGTTQPEATEDAAYTGPAFDVHSCESQACPLPVDGTALFIGGFQPKRMINIYDGPFFADGNVFTQTKALECDPTVVDESGAPQCGIYMSTVQPVSCNALSATQVEDGGGSGMCVLNAAVGWKQPNGFYYPPAFAFESSAFDATSVRHNVLDQYGDYIAGTVTSPSAPQSYSPLRAQYPGTTPIDASTILNDLDGTFTGTCWGENCESAPASSPQLRTSSVSSNRFFDAPSQAPECASYGVQTSPSDFLTTVIAPVAAGGGHIDSSVWSDSPFPAVPIYRQLLLADESPCSGPVCSGGTWSCDHASFMMGAQNGQAPYLTASGGTYYLNIAGAGETTACVDATGVFIAPFTAGSSYVLYQLFAKETSKATYQIPTGTPAAGKWVWVQPHLLSTTTTNGNDLLIEDITDMDLVQALDALVTQRGDVLEIAFDGSVLGDLFTFQTRADDDKCLPRDACQLSADGTQCELATGFIDPGLETQLGDICSKWVTRVGGSTSDSGGLSLSDCPAEGCLGYQFTLPSSPSWTPTSYETTGAPLASCFPADASWDRPLSIVSQDAAVCATPPAPAGFCTGPAPTPTPTPDPE